MEKDLVFPASDRQDIDPDIFRRVWDRVMPDQTDCPVAVEGSQPDADAPDPSAPDQGQPGEDPGQLPPVPVCSDSPAQQVPDCPGAPADPVPACPGAPADPVPTCPGAPGDPVPTCPSAGPGIPCPGRPTCPVCPTPYSGYGDTDQSVSPCFTAPSQEEQQRLEALMDLAREGAAAGQAMARRAKGAVRQTLSGLAADHRRAFRQLSAAHFLLTGRRCPSVCPAPQLPASLALAIREQFLWEQQWEQKARQWAQDTQDPCLKELYLELAQDGSLHRGVLRSLLEQLCIS